MSTAVTELLGPLGGNSASGELTSPAEATAERHEVAAQDVKHTQRPERSESKAPNGGWVEEIWDGELREFVKNKGWRSPVEMAVGYRNLEKLIGGEKVPLPKGEADAEGWERVYKALGRPATPEDYALADKESAAQYHKLGLSARQANELSGWQETLKTTQAQQAKEEAAQQRSQQLAAIRKEWGGEYDENLRLGKRAVREFGLESQVEKLEEALGSGELLKLTAKLGRGLRGRHVRGRSSGAEFREDG